METNIAMADCALDEWAKWAVERLNGWPARTLLARAMEDGITGAAHSSHAPMALMPEYVAATDRAVCNLDVLERRVVIVYYLTYQDSEAKAKECDCSPATFWRRLQRAQKNVWNHLHCERETPTLQHAV